MVNKCSATAASNYLDDVFPIDHNHSDIVKFKNERCQYYQIVQRIIEDLVKDVQGLNRNLSPRHNSF